MEKRKSIVLVTVDCLRADHIGFLGYDRPTTPFLDSVASESVVCSAAIVAGAPTYYSLPAIMASRYPLALGRNVLGLAPDEPTLARVLKQAGYSTAGFSAGNPYISWRFGYHQNFDTFNDCLAGEVLPPPDGTAEVAAGNAWASQLNRRLQKIRPALGPFGLLYDELYFEYCQRVTPVAHSLEGLRRFPAANVIVDQACSWLASAGEAPIFLWLHLMDAHAPYFPTEEGLRLTGEPQVAPFRARYLNCYWNRSDLGPRRLAGCRENIVALYDAGIRWVDVQVARLVEALKKCKRWDGCVFALTADHGEEFLDHGGRFHPPSRLFEELIRVPLLLRVPGGEPRGIMKSPFSMVHLAPTLLEAAQLPTPAAFDGRSKWKQMRGGSAHDVFAISESIAECTNPFYPKDRMGPRVLSVRESRFKLILHFDPPGDRLFDLEADPGEHASLAMAVQKPVRRRLLEAAHEHLRRQSERRDERMRLRTHLRELKLEWQKSADKPPPVAS